MANIIHLNTLLCIMIMMLLDHYVSILSEMTGYINEFNENKIMSPKVKDKQLLKNFSKI